MSYRRFRDKGGTRKSDFDYVVQPPSTPPHSHECKRMVPRPRKVFDEICPTCRNARFIRGLHGEGIPCPRCQEED